MSGLNKFIVHSNITEIVSRLDEMLVVNDDGEVPGILLLLGLPRTGKKAVLSYWLNQEHLPAEQRTVRQQPPIAYLSLWQPLGQNLGRNVYVTPITCVVFSELAYSLGKISAHFVPTYAKRWYREPKSLYRDSQFTSLFAFVRSEVQRLRLRAIIIQHAEWIDARTLEMLMLLREECRRQIAFVLSAQMQEKADLDEPLANEFLRVPEAAKVCTRVKLERLTREEYLRTIFSALVDDLHLFFAADLADPAIAKQVPGAFWQRTGHDWKQIQDVVKDIQHKVRSDKDGKRVITRAQLEQVLKCSFASSNSPTSGSPA